MTESSPIAAVILAGGRGERLGGVVKARLRVGNVPLVERVLQTVRPQADILLVSAGAHPGESIWSSDRTPVLPDPDAPPAGPVSGLAAAVAWCHANAPEAEYLLSVAVDTPFFPGDFVVRALPRLTHAADAIVGSTRGNAFPTNALWRLSAIADLPARVQEGAAPRGMKAVVARDRVTFLDYDADVFRNINTIDDLIAAGGAAWRNAVSNSSN